MSLRIASLAALLPALLIGTGCDVGRGCTLIGADSHVSVDLDLYVSAHPEVTSLLVRVDGEPHRVAVSGFGPVQDPDIRPGRQVRISVEFLAPRDRLIAKRDGTFTPKKFQPNGPGCEPVVGVVALTVAADGALTDKP